MQRQWLLILAVVLLIRLPFLNQAVQGDDTYFLAGAQHAQIEPLHPNHTSYLYLGHAVSMRAHTHPPLNVWFLAGLLAMAGDVYEVLFHAAYLMFSLIAAFSMWSLARRFTARPVLATLLFVATPAFVVNGNSLESDVPFLAFWLAATALFVWAVDARNIAGLAGASVAMALAALMAYQSIFLVPVLAVYIWLKRTDWLLGWCAVLTVPVVLGAWQLWERASTGELPVSTLVSALDRYGMHTLSGRGISTVVLIAHSAWLVCPVLAVMAFWPARRAMVALAGAAAIAAAFVDPHPLFWGSIGIGVLMLIWCIGRLRPTDDADARFLVLWVLLYFAGAAAMFFAGAARYLLPVAAPVALLVTRALNARPKWIAAGAALHLLFSFGLSLVNYQYCGAFRQFAESLRKETESQRVWINGEWGLRYYFESDGGLPLAQGQTVRPGEMVVSSELALPVQYATGGGALAPVAEHEVRVSLPLRLYGIGAKSAYASVSLGRRPFDLGRGPVDKLRAMVVVEQKPELSYLPMNATAAERQIVSGLYGVEEGGWRWMSGRASLLLKRPEGPSRIEISLYIPDQAPARRITVSVDGVAVIEKTLPSAGSYTLQSGPVSITSATPSITIEVDRTFSAPGDSRELGVVVSGAGFRPLE